MSSFRPVAFAAILAVAATAGAVTAQDPFVTDPAQVRAGFYDLDASHGKITWSVSHMGFSTYVGQFVNVSGELTLDPANPANSTLSATIPLADVASNNDGLNGHLRTADFFDVDNHPTATFVATSIVVDDDDADEATVTGDLTLRGVTRPVVMEVEFNQAGVNPVNQRYTVGFDGEASIQRSEFGIAYGLPLLGDEVELHIEGEFILRN